MNIWNLDILWLNRLGLVHGYSYWDNNLFQAILDNYFFFNFNLSTFNLLFNISTFLLFVTIFKFKPSFLKRN